MEQLLASSFITILGILYLVFFKKIADFVVKANYKLNNSLLLSDKEPTKWSFRFARFAAVIQAIALVYFGCRGLIRYYFNV